MKWYFGKDTSECPSCHEPIAKHSAIKLTVCAAYTILKKEQRRQSSL